MKIICIGRNYVEHARELNNEVPGEPLVFMKPSTALNTTGVISIPSFTKDMHYELELVVKISKLANNISEEQAQDYYDSIGLGIDFTARDVQDECKKKGHPWEKAKAFNNSATVSEFRDISNFIGKDIDFKLVRNGKTVQNAHSGLMIFNINFLIAYCSKYFTLEPGDLIFTGTPAGVAAVESGDVLEGYLSGELLHKVRIN